MTVHSVEVLSETVYLLKVGVRLKYTLPSLDPTGVITLGFVVVVEEI